MHLSEADFRDERRVTQRLTCRMHTSPGLAPVFQ